jgi:hypothetical protein
LQLDDGEGVNVVEEIPPTPKQKPRCPRKSVAMVVKEENDEDVASKNWEDSAVHTLIAICGEMEAEFLKNAKKQDKPKSYVVCIFFISRNAKSFRFILSELGF